MLVNTNIPLLITEEIHTFVGKYYHYTSLLHLKMRNTNTEWINMSDTVIVKQLGHFIKHTRLQQNTTQAQLAKMAGLNRWTISQIENGESVTLSSFIQILRALDILYVLNSFEINDEISPIEYAKLQEKKRQRARLKKSDDNKKDDLGW